MAQPLMPDREMLAGGVANAGAVYRVGDVVVRPASEFSPSVHRFLTEVRRAGCDGVPAPVGIDANGQERLSYIAGDVGVPPYPPWVQQDGALASIAALLRTVHDAARGVGLEGRWSDEMADPRGGEIVCHNDVCLENVVFSDGRAVALLDWDFAAPGRPVYDLAQMARMCVPVDDDVSADRLGWHVADRPQRLRIVCDVYGLTAAEREDMLGELDEAIRVGGRFVLRRVERGDANFVEMWNRMGGMRRFDRRREWWSGARATFAAALR